MATVNSCSVFYLGSPGHRIESKCVKEGVLISDFVSKTKPVVKLLSSGSTSVLPKKSFEILSKSSYDQNPREDGKQSRRDILKLATFSFVSFGASVGEKNGNAKAGTFIIPPQGYRSYVDRMDGYSFFYPDDWVQVRGAGADVFFRDPSTLDENLSVNISSPSSSRFAAVSDLGTPSEAAEIILKQYLTEFMSTRLGVMRESQVISTISRTAPDGREYYEIQVNVKSYANNNQLAILPEDRVSKLEWDRRYLLVLGVENKRLYQLRLQAPEKAVDQAIGELRKIMDSFQVIKLAV